MGAVLSSMRTLQHKCNTSLYKWKIFIIAARNVLKVQKYSQFTQKIHLIEIYQNVMLSFSLNQEEEDNNSFSVFTFNTNKQSTFSTLSKTQIIFCMYNFFLCFLINILLKKSMNCMIFKLCHLKSPKTSDYNNYVLLMKSLSISGYTRTYRNK